MQRLLFILCTLSFVLSSLGQKIDTHHINPDSTNYPNVYVKTISNDSVQSTFIIWVKQSVQPHYHAHHTEYVQVLSGKGRMTLDSTSFSIRKGDVILIPMGTVHSVKTTSRHALKVISVQAPHFDGDRVLVYPQPAKSESMEKEKSK